MTPRRTARHARPARHGRHGREDRSPVVRPPLPQWETRVDRFELTVASTADFLSAAWPELRDVSFEWAGLPANALERGIPRWHVDKAEKRIIIFRIPIERLGRHRHDALHRRMRIESAVFCAAAEYLDRDPWDLGYERFRFL